jgi:hypothetical protein
MIAPTPSLLSLRAAALRYGVPRSRLVAFIVGGQLTPDVYVQYGTERMPLLKPEAVEPLLRSRGLLKPEARA